MSRNFYSSTKQNVEGRQRKTATNKKKKKEQQTRQHVKEYTVVSLAWTILDIKCFLEAQFQRTHLFLVCVILVCGNGSIYTRHSKSIKYLKTYNYLWNSQVVRGCGVDADVLIPLYFWFIRKLINGIYRFGDLVSHGLGMSLYIDAHYEKQT